MRCVWAALLLAVDATAVAETLPNGITLPTPWPPRLSALSRQPVTPHYLANPPEVIPIDTGRQLFVDDFLIAGTTLARTYHLPDLHPGNPLVVPDQPWEQEGEPTAMPFSDGVWFDPKDRQLKLWYMCGYLRATCLAVSEDGLRWKKPAFDVTPGTNVVLAAARDSATVWLDGEAKDPGQRYKLFRVTQIGGGDLVVYSSADGIHWRDPPVLMGPVGDRTTVFWNPFRNVWVYSLRAPVLLRHRLYWETGPDLDGAAKWSSPEEPPLWIGADALDPARADLKTAPELYNLDAVAYESVIVGLFTIWRGQPPGRPKPNDVVLGYSRDGWSWHRPDRRAFLPVSERQGDWNHGNVQSAGGGFLVVGDKLNFFFSGRAGVPGTRKNGVSAVGLATLRRDGFASMDAGAAEGTLTTRPVRFRGKHLFVNLDAPAGSLAVELLEAGARRLVSRPLGGNGTRLAVAWRGAADLSSFANRPVQFRFRLRKGKLYAFWVSADESGASRGYVAAGGPGFSGSIDDGVGRPGAR